MDERPIIIISDAALFDLGVSVGFGAVVGGFMAIVLYSSLEFLWNKITSKRRPNG